MVKYIPSTKTLPYLVVDNYFSEIEVRSMLNELHTLRPKMEYQEPEIYDGTDPIDTKKNRSISLDSVYNSREDSYIMRTLHNIYQDKHLEKKLKSLSWFYDAINHVNLDSTFASYYENSDYYKRHKDISVISIMYWLWEEPKSFEGGDIYFPDFDEKISVKRNRFVIMPSSTSHEVDSIKYVGDEEGMGRYSIIKFLYIYQAEHTRMLSQLMNRVGFNETQEQWKQVKELTMKLKRQEKQIKEIKGK